MGLIVIITAVIFNGAFPLLASAIGKYVKTLPHSLLLLKITHSAFL
ncbi:MAG: hypothetical protein AJITA_01340 [Acetilactobacillus jinshanensis]